MTDISEVPSFTDDLRNSSNELFSFLFDQDFGNDADHLPFDSEHEFNLSQSDDNDSQEGNPLQAEMDAHAKHCHTDCVTEEMFALGIDMVLKNTCLLFAPKFRKLKPPFYFSKELTGLDYHTQGRITEQKGSVPKKPLIRTHENYLSLRDKFGEDILLTKIKQQRLDPVTEDESFYTFKFSKLRERCTYGHFQLRNLVSATTKNDVYYTSFMGLGPFGIWDILMSESTGGDTVRQWSPHLQCSREILDVRLANSPQSLMIRISSMACAYNFLMVGGNNGEYACRRIDDTEAPVHYGKTTDHVNGIANHIEIITDRRGGIKSIISSNDQKVRYMNMERMKIENTLLFPYAVNCSAMSPGKDMLCVVGDSTEISVVEAASGAVVMRVDEHIDYSFACCWHPDGRTFATGNQDKTTRQERKQFRIYDIRYPSKSLYVLGAKVGAIRSLKYSSDGKYLAASEHIDFVHIYDTSTYQSSQLIDMFGEISGLSFTPEDQSLYIANSDKDYG
ncbi:hypothetical protein EC973_006406 [Apophysomyces ossiformis]|uniref:Uncharacterized protein n=1 Tax=Apophysomyces ossiformis TaxID=679940 RepID=A0A8H7ETL4_9FUNG|nr:hypothetical protein EC973_006406 [Apophysomyces ossiformis]